jgi:hypothetical protein
MTIVEWMTISVLGVWLAASVQRQFPGTASARLDAVDLFHIIPIWTFFAPRPGESDFHLLYRDHDAAGLTSDWREIPTTFENHPLRMIWNPRKRVAKGVLDMTQVLMQIRGEPLAVTRLSIAYLALLNFVCSQHAESSARAREFVIAETHGYLPLGPLQLVFRSDVHALH